MLQVVRSLYFWVGVCAITGVYYPVGAIIALALKPFDPTRSFAHRFASAWGRALGKLNPRWKFEVIGQDRIPNDRPLVLVSNHEGMADILLAFHLDHHFKWIAKEVLFKVPALGWYMSHAGYIPLKRGKRESIKVAMEAAREYLKSGVSVLLFPEGTRSEDGELRPFKPGAFRLAIEGGYDILPMAITGSRETLPKNSWLFPDQLSDMKILVGDVIHTRGLSLGDVDRLGAQTREVVQGLKAQLEGQTAYPAMRQDNQRARDSQQHAAIG